MNQELKKTKILIFVGNGFGFNEIFRTPIADLGRDSEIDLLISDYYLADHSQKAAKTLLREGKIRSLEVIHPFGEGQSIFAHHNTINSIVRKIKQKRYDLLLLGSDFYLFERYLINAVKRNGTKVVAMQTGVLTQTLEEYLGRQGKLKIRIAAAQPKSYYEKLHATKSLWRSIYRRIRLHVRVWYEKLLNHYLLPLLFTGSVLPPDKLDILGFTSGRSDAAICYDPLEAEALKALLPSLPVYLTEHPSSRLCRCHKEKLEKNKLYALLAGPIDEEMEPNTLHRWIKIITSAASLLHSREIHLRFHPRTNPSLSWPKKLINELRAQSRLEIKIIDSMKVSLPEHICEYGAVLGAMSGSLRSARVSCNTIPVIGLPNLSTFYAAGDEWILGRAEGITLLEDEKLQPQHLTFKFAPSARPTVAEILRQII